MRTRLNRMVVEDRAGGPVVQVAAIPRIPWSFAYLVCAAAATALVVTMLVGAGAPHASLPGLPDAGPITGWGLPGMRLAAELAGMLAIGGLLTAAVLLPDRAGRLEAAAAGSVRVTTVASVAVAAAAVVQIQLTVSDFLGVPPLRMFGASDLSGSVVGTMQGRALLLQCAFATLVAAAGRRLTSRRGAGLLLIPAAVAVAAPSLAGHASVAANQVAAVSSLLLHIVAASLWVGGLVALVIVVRSSRVDLPGAVSRFSRLAMVCIIAVLVSGVVNAWVETGSPAGLVGTSYGLLVLAKAGALLLLAGVGWRHRRSSIPALVRGSKSTFVRLAGAEVVLMAATVGLAVGLARTPIH
jgi:putative copper resistance protein D